MRRDGEWGDNVEIQCMSEIYERPIEIYAYQTTPMKTYSRPSRDGHQVPIRLSYHFQSHYNSIVDPLMHHLSTTTKAPGDIEDRTLQYSVWRSPGSLNAAMQLTDMEATELETMRMAIANSREEFKQHEGIEFDRAVNESILVLEQARQKKEQLDIAKAKEASLIDITGPSAVDPATVDQQLLDHAMKESRAEAYLTGTEAGLPCPVRRCMEMGYSIERCMEAFSIFGLQPHVADDIVIENMTSWLSNRGGEL